MLYCFVVLQAVVRLKADLDQSRAAEKAARRATAVQAKAHAEAIEAIKREVCVWRMEGAREGEQGSLERIKGCCCFLSPAHLSI